MDSRTLNEEYQNIAQELIDTEPELAYIKESDVTIVCLSSEHEKKTKEKIIFGQCEKVAEKYKWGIPADFTITIFEPNVVDFSEDQLRILIFHELLHVGIDGDSFYCRPHDTEDFKAIITRFGVDWAQTE